MSRYCGNDNQVCVSLCMHKRGTRRLLCSQKSLILRYEVPKANAFSEQRVNRFAMKSCFAGLLEDSSLKLRMTVLGCRFLVPRKASSDTNGVILERSEGSGRNKDFRRIFVPNHACGVYGIRNLLRYGIATRSRMESSRWRYTLVRYAIHVFDVIPFRRFATDAIPSLLCRLG